MNQDYGTTIYFTSESDARKAASDLLDSGYDAEIRSEGSHGQSFWDSIKSFFRGEREQEAYRGGAAVVVSGGDPQSIGAIAQRYNGRISGSAQPDQNPQVTGTSDAAKAAATMGSPPPGPHTVIGETGVSGGSVTSDVDETQTHDAQQ